MDDDTFWGKFLRSLIQNYRKNYRRYFLLNAFMLIALCSLNLFVDRNYYEDLVVQLSWAFAGMGILLQIAAAGLTIWVHRRGASTYQQAPEHFKRFAFDNFKKDYSEFVWQGILGLIGWVIIAFFLARWSIPYMIGTLSLSMLLISIPTWLKTG